MVNSPIDRTTMWLGDMRWAQHSAPEPGSGVDRGAGQTASIRTEAGSVGHRFSKSDFPLEGSSLELQVQSDLCAGCVCPAPGETLRVLHQNWLL